MPTVNANAAIRSRLVPTSSETPAQRPGRGADFECGHEHGVFRRVGPGRYVPLAGYPKRNADKHVQNAKRH